MKKIMIGAVSIIPLLIGLCIIIYIYGPNFNLYLIPPSPERYGKIALKKMDDLGLYASGETWEENKIKAQKKLKKVSSYGQARDVLTPVLKLAGGKHSQFIQKETSSRAVKQSTPNIKRLDNGIIYIKLPPFTSVDKKQSKKYADALNHFLSQKEYQGVILDLSDNTGGNMAPMLIGLSSILPNGRLFSLINKYNQRTAFDLTNNRIDNQETIALTDPIHKKKVPVAIIMNNRTASSGEVVGLSFKGLENVHYFGQHSAGYTTGNMVFWLYDGTQVNLTTSILMDRQGKRYENDPLQPDTWSENPIRESKNWLKSKMN
ncbi:S41 family peptidase [Streptococcus halotolerans]|uniref:S41 family peptidase n=1 Tax=Streptococcus halotolerans TaxID=1814128 RepID=UPI000788F4BB|nr:S41 family peptidase [Streptococcus halotolerans]